MQTPNRVGGVSGAHEFLSPNLESENLGENFVNIVRALYVSLSDVFTIVNVDGRWLFIKVIADDFFYHLGSQNIHVLARVEFNLITFVACCSQETDISSI